MKKLMLGVLAMASFVVTSCNQAQKNEPTMKISKINLTDRTIDEVFATISPEKIACCNWAEEYPYAPEVSFKMFHTGDKLYLRFDVAEQYTAARVTEDNGRVWTDSCCEFFLSLDGKAYYNIETSCIGHMLVDYHPTGTSDKIRAGEEIFSQVERISTLGTEPFEERVGDNRWSLTLILPPAVMHQHNIESWDGLKLTANLYKCGDNLSHPHFLSWKPIVLPKPRFHCPEFFKPIEME